MSRRRYMRRPCAICSPRVPTQSSPSPSTPTRPTPARLPTSVRSRFATSTDVSLRRSRSGPTSLLRCP